LIKGSGSVPHAEKDYKEKAGYMKRSKLAEEGLLNQLEELSEGLGVKIRYEKILKEGSFFSGGLCRIKGEEIIIINSKVSIEDKIDILAKALMSFNLSQVFIKPALREFLSQYQPGEIGEIQEEELGE
jgi:hypothetical protein